MNAARTATQWHDVLANYFASLPLFIDDAEGFGLDDKPTERKVSELPFHLMSAGRWEEVEATMILRQPANSLYSCLIAYISAPWTEKPAALV